MIIKKLALSIEIRMNIFNKYFIKKITSDLLANYAIFYIQI